VVADEQRRASARDVLAPVKDGLEPIGEGAGEARAGVAAGEDAKEGRRRHEGSKAAGA
jgi:hypothetical protein